MRARDSAEVESEWTMEDCDLARGLPPSVSRLSMLLPPSYIPLFSRVSEPEIKEYLRRVLGSEAPQPEWGLPDGWGAYLAGEMGYIYFGR